MHIDQHIQQQLEQYNNDVKEAVKKGIELLEKNNLEDAIPHLRFAAEANDVVALRYLGDFYFYGNGVEQDHKKAFEYYLLAAIQNDIFAIGSAGNMLLTGDGVEKNVTLAVSMLQIAAKADDIAAIVYLGHHHYSTGDKELALIFFTKAANANSDHPAVSSAQYTLGAIEEMNYLGGLLPNQMMKAHAWYKKSAERGNEKAIKALNERFNRTNN